MKSSSAQQYLDEDGHWRGGERHVFLQSTPGSVTVTTDPMPFTGHIYIRFGIKEEDPIAGSSSFYPYYATIDCSKSYISLANNALTDFIEEREKTNTGNNLSMYVPDDYEILMGDIPTNIPNSEKIYKGGLFYLSGSTYVKITGWHSEKTDTYAGVLSLVDLIGRRLLMAYSTPKYQLTGEILCHFNSLTIGNTLDRYFAFHTSEYNMRSCIWNIIMNEVRNFTEIGIEYEDESGDLLFEDGDKLILE